jgi:hypothetical protein
MIYAETCYDSGDFKKQSSKIPSSSVLNKVRHRGEKLSFSQTNESIATSALFLKDSKFNNSDPSKFHWTHEKLEPFTFVAWMQIFNIIALIAHGVVFVISPLMFLCLLVILFGEGGFSAFLGTLKQYLYMFIPAIMIEYLPVLILSEKRLKNNLRFFIRKKHCLNRQTGMVTLYGAGNRVIYQYPFLEFDCIFQSNPNHQGLLSYRLLLVHRYNDDKHIIDLGSEIGLHAPVADYHRLWNMVQRFMDVSQPLPDIPMLEPFRSLDPVTAQHDEKTGRNPTYWRSMNDEQYQSALKEMTDKQKRIPASGPVINIFES